jgi:hypothetical protein
MAGKITTILAKREAETYCTQGLHKEALHIYHRLIATTPNIDPTLKAGIDSQIEKISAELESDDVEEAKRLTADDILRVKKGWGDDATVSDVMICAQAFCQIGCYKEAFYELAGMLRKGCATEKTPPLLADCLAKMYSPEQVVDVIENLSAKNFNFPENALQYVALLAQEMVNLKHPHHAEAILAYLENHPESNGNTFQRLGDIADSIERPDPEQGDAAPDLHAAVPEQTSPEDDSIQNPLPGKKWSHLKDKTRSFLRRLPFTGNKS